MEIEYDLTRNDLYAFQWRAAFRSPRSRRSTRNTYIYWFLTLLLFASLPAIGADGFVVSRINVTFLVIAFPTIVLTQRYLERRLMRRAILKLLDEELPGKGQLGRHRVALTGDGVIESTAVGESRTSWAGVHRVEQDADYIFIYTSSAAAYVVPRRAFADPAAAEAFFRACADCKAASGPETARPTGL